MKPQPLEAQSQARPMFHAALVYSGLVFGLMAFVGPALEAEAWGAVAVIAVAQLVALYRGVPLVKDLTADEPRLVLDGDGLGYRHLGDHWFRRVAWARVGVLERRGDRLWVEFAGAGEDPAGAEFVDLRYLDLDLAAIDAFVATVGAEPGKVIRLRPAA